MRRPVLFLLNIFTALNTLPAFAVDAKNPTMVFDPQTNKYFIGQNSKFILKQGEMSSLIDRIEVSIDSGEYQPYGDAVAFKEEGKHTLKFRAVNPVNNWSPVQFLEVFVDLTAPSTEAHFTEDKFYQGKDAVFVALHSHVTLSAQDNLSGVADVEYSFDNKSFTPYSKPLALDKPGKHSIFYRSKDRVGNQEQVHELAFMVDGSAPVSDLKLQGAKPAILNGKNFVSDGVAFTLTAQDDLSQVKQIWVGIDGKEQPYLKPIYFLQEGPHTLTYYSVDQVGNKEEKKSFAFYTVSHAPKTLANPMGALVNTGGINYARPDFQLALSASDNVVGLDHIEYKTDADTEFKPYIQPVRFNTPGAHSVSYRSVDRAGNVEPNRVFTVNLTDAAPETTIATAQPLVEREGVTYSPAPNVITFNVGNSPVGIKQTVYSINDAPFTAYQGPITLGSDQRVYKITYKTSDKLGNEESPRTMTFNMIGSVPVVDLFVSDGKTSGESVRTNYLEQPSKPAEATRAIASPQKKKK